MCVARLYIDRHYAWRSDEFGGNGGIAGRGEFGIEERLGGCLDAIGRAAAAAGDHAEAAGSLERSLELHVKVGGMASRGRRNPPFTLTTTCERLKII